ncbi:MAG: hypothetical protein ACO32I_09635, partial [Candidatus Limnocylindrus sp.]
SNANLHAAANEPHHTVINAQAPKSWKTQLAASSPALVTAGVGGYAAYQINNKANQVISGIGSLGHNVGEWVTDGTHTLGRNMPRPGDIEHAISQRAGNVLSAVSGPATEVLTITMIIGGMIIAYEVYQRFA